MQISNGVNKQKLPLYIALCVPVLMIIIVAAMIYLPGIGKTPKVNFLYATGQYIYDYGYGNGGYRVTGGHLAYTPVPLEPPLTNQTNNLAYPDVHFYLYDVGTNQSSELTFAQAQNYTLDPTNTSSDGYTVQQGNGGGGDFLFGGGGGDYSSWFIKGHNRAIKLNLKLTGAPYSNFRFLGWVQ